MIKSSIKFQDISDLLSFTLNTAFLNKELVDEDGYILSNSGDKLEMDNANVVILSERIEDIEANVLNPFLNERKISSQLNYYYKILSTSILIRLISTISEVLQQAHHVKKHSELNNKKERDKYIRETGCNLKMSPKLNDLVSVVGNSIDKNTLKHFKLFQSTVQSKKIENICYYGYNIKEEEANFNITYIDENDVFKGGVNNNNIKIIRDLTLKILCDNDNDFLTEKASKNTHSKRYDSIIRLYFKMIKRFNTLINCLDNEDYNCLIIDEDEIDKHLKNLTEYSKSAHSRIFVSHKNSSPSANFTLSEDSPSKDDNVIYDAMGNPINLRKQNEFSPSGPDRTYNGPSFPNVVPVSSGHMYGPMNNLMYNNFNPNVGNNMMYNNAGMYNQPSNFQMGMNTNLNNALN